MYQKKPTTEEICPFEYALNLIGGKWDLRIVCLLAHNRSLRFCEIKKQLPMISDTALSACLKKLISNNLIKRHSYPEVVPHVDYTLSERGIDLVPILQSLCQWSMEIKNENTGARLLRCDHCKYGITC